MISDGNGNYVESSESEFPTEGYKFNSELSGCIDLNGNRIDSTLRYSDGMISLSSDKTSMCYVYFDEILNAGKILFRNPTVGLNTTMEGGLYRYQGTSVNNYICFGISDKTTCVNDTDKYMYRIIGINSDNQLKLIKKEALNTNYGWHSSNKGNITWPNSALYMGLNESYFLSNETYVPSGWGDKIATTTWKYGDNTTYNTSALNLYSIENGWTETTNAKIGLMYVHDYYYAYQSGGLNCSPSGAYNNCATSWIHLWKSENDSNASHTYEWTMSRYAHAGNNNPYAAHIVTNGWVNYILAGNTFSVRPVFFLTSDIQYLSGTGTLTDPILIK